MPRPVYCRKIKAFRYEIRIRSTKTKSRRVAECVLFPIEMIEISNFVLKIIKFNIGIIDGENPPIWPQQKCQLSLLLIQKLQRYEKN